MRDTPHRIRKWQQVYSHRDGNPQQVTEEQREKLSYGSKQVLDAGADLVPRRDRGPSASYGGAAPRRRSPSTRGLAHRRTCAQSLPQCSSSIQPVVRSTALSQEFVGVVAFGRFHPGRPLGGAAPVGAQFVGVRPESRRTARQLAPRRRVQPTDGSGRTRPRLQTLGSRLSSGPRAGSKRSTEEGSGHRQSMRETTSGRRPSSWCRAARTTLTVRGLGEARGPARVQDLLRAGGTAFLAALRSPAVGCRRGDCRPAAACACDGAYHASAVDGVVGQTRAVIMSLRQTPRREQVLKSANLSRRVSPVSYPSRLWGCDTAAIPSPGVWFAAGPGSGGSTAAARPRPPDHASP